MPEKKERAIITDKLVVEKTGKTMETWFKLLDKKGAKLMKHTDIFNLISTTEGKLFSIDNCVSLKNRIVINDNISRSRYFYKYSHRYYIHVIFIFLSSFIELSRGGNLIHR